MPHSVKCYGCGLRTRQHVADVMFLWKVSCASNVKGFRLNIQTCWIWILLVGLIFFCQFVLNFKGLPAFSNMETNVVFLVVVMFHQWKINKPFQTTSELYVEYFIHHLCLISPSKCLCHIWSSLATSTGERSQNITWLQSGGNLLWNIIKELSQSFYSPHLVLNQFKGMKQKMDAQKNV